MLAPAAGGGGGGYTVSPHMLSSAASYLHGEAQGIASSRNKFNSACYTAEGAFGEASAKKGFNEFFEQWFTKLDAQAETLESTAQATQQCAVNYDHAEKKNYAAIPAMRTAPPASPPQNNNPFPGLGGPRHNTVA